MVKIVLTNWATEPFTMRFPVTASSDPRPDAAVILEESEGLLQAMRILTGSAERILAMISRTRSAFDARIGSSTSFRSW